MNKIIYETIKGSLQKVPKERQHYFYEYPKKLLGVNNAKILKGNKKGVKTAILHLLPDSHVKDYLGLEENFTVCPLAPLANCKKDCLVNTGRGTMSNVFWGRFRKTLLYKDNLPVFKKLLIKDIQALERKANRENLELAIRINGTSDIDIIRHFKDVLKMFPNVQFYDYTKIPKYIKRLNKLHKNNELLNYHLTFSYSNSKKFQPYIKQATEYKSNIAIVFENEKQVNYLLKNKKKLKLYDNVYNIVSGDKDDLRYKDKHNSIVALYFKKPKINHKQLEKPQVKDFVIDLDQLPNTLTII